MIKAPYFKIESFGAVDGPGVRLVIFLQGCHLRCKYCHNPESWEIKKSNDFITPEEVIAKYKKNQGYYKNGGITLSGGEPLIHVDFCVELARLCHENNINLALDTNAAPFEIFTKKFKEIVKYKPLWLIDIKCINKEIHRKLTGAKSAVEFSLISFLEENEQNYWIRQVLLPGWTDNGKDLLNLGKYLSTLKHMKKFELLPYHKMAIGKYEKLGMKYPLKDAEEPTPELIKKSMEKIRKGLLQK